MDVKTFSHSKLIQPLVLGIISPLRKNSAFRSAAPEDCRLPLAKTYLNTTATGENIPQNQIWRPDWTLLSVSSLYVVMALWRKDRNLLEKPNNLLMIFPEETTSYLIGRV